jgi:hypothetical protein
VVTGAKSFGETGSDKPLMRIRNSYWIFLLVNLLFWVWFWVDISNPLRPVTPAGFDNLTPIYVFGRRAVPPIPTPHNRASFEVMAVAQLPSLIVAKGVLRAADLPPFSAR